jgi:hypothetical protein
LFNAIGIYIPNTPVIVLYFCKATGGETYNKGNEKKSRIHG